MKFNKLYEELFKPATPSEIKSRLNHLLADLEVGLAAYVNENSKFYDLHLGSFQVDSINQTIKIKYLDPYSPEDIANFKDELDMELDEYKATMASFDNNEKANEIIVTYTFEDHRIYEELFKPILQ